MKGKIEIKDVTPKHIIFI